MQQHISSHILISSELKRRCLCVFQGSWCNPRKTRKSNDRSFVKWLLQTGCSYGVTLFSTGPWWVRTSEDTSSRILVSGSKWINEVGFTPRPLHPTVKIPLIRRVGGWVHLRTGLYAVEKTNIPGWQSMSIFFPSSSQYLGYCTILAIRVFPCYNGFSPLVRCTLPSKLATRSVHSKQSCCSVS